MSSGSIGPCARVGNTRLSHERIEKRELSGLLVARARANGTTTSNSGGIARRPHSRPRACIRNVRIVWQCSRRIGGPRRHRHERVPILYCRPRGDRRWQRWARLRNRDAGRRAYRPHRRADESPARGWARQELSLICPGKSCDQAANSRLRYLRKWRKINNM